MSTPPRVVGRCRLCGRDVTQAGIGWHDEDAHHLRCWGDVWIWTEDERDRAQELHE